MHQPEPPPRRLLVVGVFLSAASWAAALAYAASPSGSPEPASESAMRSGDVEAIGDAVKALVRSGHADSALVVLDAGLPIVRERGDEAGEVELLIHRGMVLKYTEGGAAAESFLREVLGRARALGDCRLLVAALYQLGQAIDDQGRPPRAQPVYEELIERAAECGEPRYVGRAHTFLARHDLRAGDFEAARRRVEASQDVFREAGLEDERLAGRFLLGVVLVRMGRLDEARACWEEAADWARRTGLSPSVLGSSLNNLGRLEMAVGDPGRAAAYWREAEALLRETGRDRAAVTPAKNGALALADLGRTDEALALLEELRDRADSSGWADLSEVLRVDIADLQRHSGRWRAADGLYRDLLERVSAGAQPELRANLVIGYTDVVAQRDGPGAAADWLTGECEALRSRVEPEQRGELDAQLGWQLERAGRHAEAEPMLAACLQAADAAGWTRIRLSVVPALARSQRALGRPDQALATLRYGAATWEGEREVPSDPTWREQRGSLGAETFTELAALLLEHPPELSDAGRRAAAYEALRNYKTRTLLERMRGPSTSASAPPATPPSTEPQPTEAPSSGEPPPAEPPPTPAYPEDLPLVPARTVLLDCFAGPRFSLLFVVTEEGLEARHLPAASEARAALDQYRELVRSRPASKARRESDRFVREALLAGVPDSLPPDFRILWSADGPWHLLPLATILVEGEPLLARHEIIRIPSLAVLARVQRDPAAHGPTHVVAIAGAAGADGRWLPGADREVASLARRFRHVDIRRDPAAIMAGLRDGGVLHVAAHTEVDDRRPWRSGFALGDGAGEQAWLRAADVAGVRMGAGLAVLSGCETAGGRVLSGEGVIGLTGAFLSAGVSAVISSTWPVSDRAAADLMMDLYDRLAAGETVAAALRGAQLERSEAGAPPDEWAAFVVVGNGDLTVPIERRRAEPPPVLWMAIGLGGLLVAWRLHSRSHVAETRRTVVP